MTSPFRDMEEGLKAQVARSRRELQLVRRKKDELSGQNTRVTAVVDLQKQFTGTLTQEQSRSSNPFVKGVIWGSVAGLVFRLAMFLGS